MQVVGRFYFVCVGWVGHSFKRHRVDNGSLINTQRPLGHVAHEEETAVCLDHAHKRTPSTCGTYLLAALCSTQPRS